MRGNVHWYDLLIAAIALWLLASPTVLGFDAGQVPGLQAPALNAYAAGTCLLVYCVISAWRVEDVGNEIVNMILGSWLMLSPYALGFSEWLQPSLDAILVGFVVVVLAVLDIRSTIKTARAM